MPRAPVRRGAADLAAVARGPSGPAGGEVMPTGAGHAPAQADAEPGRFAGLEAYRGVAALLVVVFHAYQHSREGTGTAREVYAGTPLHPLFHNLEAGVAWFFVLSGFLLYQPFLAADLHGAPRIRLADYARRRVLRIVPAYWLALTVLAIYPGLVGVFSGD